MDNKPSLDNKTDKRKLFKIDEDPNSGNTSMVIDKNEQDFNVKIGQEYIENKKSQDFHFQSREEVDESGESDSDLDSENENEFTERENSIELIESINDLEKVKSKVSFYEGRPKDEDEILKMECPLYRCERSTIVVKKYGRSSTTMENKNKSYLTQDSSIKKSQTIKPSDHKEKPSKKLFKIGKNAVVDINITNTLQIRTFSSLFMTILQIINCIIRYTIVQFPFCIKTLGLIYGPIIISIIGSMSIFSVYLLIRVKECTNESY
jgi:hypothetical protein